MGIIIKSICTNSFKMEYFCFGKGEKTLVILPGLSVQSVMPLAAEIEKDYSIFKDDYTVYVFDRRCDLPENYSIYDMADDTAAAFKHLNLYNINLFGASQGGMIALCIAAKYPGIIKKIAVASAAINLSDKKDIIDSWINTAKSNDIQRLYDNFAKAVYPNQLYESYKPLLSEAAKTVTKEDLCRFIILANAAVNFNFSPYVSDIHCPVFAAGAADDKVLGKYAIEEIINNFSTLPNFSYKIYEGYGHALYDLAPDFKDKLYEFFT